MNTHTFTINLAQNSSYFYIVQPSKKCCIRQLNKVQDDLRYYNEFKTIGQNSYATDNMA